MVRLFQMLAVILAGVAALFLWKQNSDWAFASGVLAACSYFLSTRFQFKARIIEREAAAAAVKDESSDESDPGVSQ